MSCLKPSSSDLPAIASISSAVLASACFQFMLLFHRCLSSCWGARCLMRAVETGIASDAMRGSSRRPVREAR
jgi:hypothetical protein